MRLLTALAVLAALSACEKKDAPAAPSQSETKAAATAPAANTGANSGAADALRTAQPKAPTPDLGVPRANYTAVGGPGGGAWLTYVAIAFGQQEPQDKELLDLFSPRYFNEPDAFKKQEIAAAELGPIKERLAAYRKQRYYSMPFGVQDQEGVGATILFAGPYDFATGSFPLGGDCGGGNMVGNRQNILLSFGREGKLCKLRVADVEMAKRVEAMRAAAGAHLRGTIHFFVTGVEGGNRVQSVPTAISYEVWDKPSYSRGGNRVADFEERL